MNNPESTIKIVENTINSGGSLGGEPKANEQIPLMTDTDNLLIEKPLELEIQNELSDKDDININDKIEEDDESSIQSLT